MALQSLSPPSYKPTSGVVGQNWVRAAPRALGGGLVSSGRGPDTTATKVFSQCLLMGFVAWCFKDWSRSSYTEGHLMGQSGSWWTEKVWIASAAPCLDGPFAVMIASESGTLSR
jgi:hypothetical protein